MKTKARSKHSAPSTQKRRKWARKNEIVLAAAQQAFIEFGYAGTSVDAIAEAAGVSKRTVYSNFETKQTLYAEVIQKLCAEVVPPALEHKMLNSDPEETLLHVSVAFLEGLYAPGQIAFYQTVVADSRQFPDAGRMLFDGPVMRTQSVFEDYFRKQQHRGLMQFPNIDLAAAQFVALLKTNMHMRLMLNQPTPVSHREIEEVSRSSIHLFLHGALVRDSSARAVSTSKPKARRAKLT